MRLQEMQAHLHMAHAWDCPCGVHGPIYGVWTTMTVPVCENCKHVDLESQEFKDAFRLAQEGFLKEHRAPKDDDADSGETGAEDCERCERCGEMARHEEAKFCWNCGRPLPRAQECFPKKHRTPVATDRAGEIEESWPDGIQFLHRTSQEFAPEVKRKMIRAMKQFLEDDQVPPKGPSEEET